MSISTPPSEVRDLLDSFATGPPESLESSFQELVAAFWQGGEATATAAPAIPSLIEAFDTADRGRAGYLAILLGLLAETEYPDLEGPFASAIAAGLDRYLNLARSVRPQEPLGLALRYLLAHFPRHRDRILAELSPGMDEDDRSRLDRALQSLDLDHPNLGRVFPSPSVWALEQEESDFDRHWISDLSPQQVLENWQADTGTVYGHTGAKAYWALRNGTPAPVPAPPKVHRDQAETVTADLALLAPHVAAMICPSCAADLDLGDGAATCRGCETRYRWSGGVLDLTSASSGGDAAGDLQFKLARMPSMGLFYEAYARPNFLRISGGNWDGAVTPEDEDAYIADSVRPVDGPVLDLAAGAGRWTQTLARVVGTDRVVALDLNPPMLSVLRTRLPQVPAILAGAGRLPFRAASLGAVLCWNALQAFPADAEAAIHEVGRCLRPGGTFSLLTFISSPDPIYRHFVHSHHFPQHQSGLTLFDLPDLHRWLEEAGLRIVEESYPGTFVLITAQR